jgi:hypothetical protein
MTIDLKVWLRGSLLADAKIVQEWHVRGHHVALVFTVGQEERRSAAWRASPPRTGLPVLLCDCDMPQGRRRRADWRKCRARAKVRKTVTAEIRKRDAATWDRIGVERAVLQLFHAHVRREYLGQENPQMLCVHDVADLLGHSYEIVLRAVDALATSGMLARTGMVLIEGKPWFGLPSEVAQLLAHLTNEEPLPSTADVRSFLEVLGGAIADNARYQGGADLFSKTSNWPNLRPDVLWLFGSQWLESALERGGPDVRASVRTTASSLLKRYDGGRTRKRKGGSR